MTRNGKIARLPREIRDELNRRLDDGGQGKDLVEWLEPHLITPNQTKSHRPP